MENNEYTIEQLLEEKNVLLRKLEKSESEKKEIKYEYEKNICKIKEECNKKIDEMQVEMKILLKYILKLL